MACESGSSDRVLTPSEIRRFWSKVAKMESCWLWTASLSVRGGYGQFVIRRNNRNILLKSHRVAFVLAHGDIPDGLGVLHNCPGGDNPRCVNPAHLWVGTCAENNLDAWRKGRLPLPQNAPVGEAHHDAKLTVAQVIEIRTRVANGTPQVVLANELGVTKTVICRIVAGRSWKHVS